MSHNLDRGILGLNSFINGKVVSLWASCLAVLKANCNEVTDYPTEYDLLNERQILNSSY